MLAVEYLNNVVAKTFARIGIKMYHFLNVLNCRNYIQIEICCLPIQLDINILNTEANCY